MNVSWRKIRMVGYHGLSSRPVSHRQSGVVETAIHTALARWEPRIEVTALDFDLSETQTGTMLITITYKVLRG